MYNIFERTDGRTDRTDGQDGRTDRTDGQDGQDGQDGRIVGQKDNTLHWDRNSKCSLFLHNGNVFVFKINNRGGKLGQNFTAHLSR